MLPRTFAILIALVGTGMAQTPAGAGCPRNDVDSAIFFESLVVGKASLMEADRPNEMNLILAYMSMGRVAMQQADAAFIRNDPAKACQIIDEVVPKLEALERRIYGR
jgi:hypothetical protein